jgi:hypothetical protein
MLQLVLDKNGNYVYQDVAQKTTPSIDTSAFEAYESKQKTTLAGDTDIGTQTQKLIRETPGQYTTTFNEETGQFETKQKDTTPVAVDVKPIEQTTVAPQETALDKVSRISAASKPDPIDFKGIAEDTIQAFKPTLKEKVIDTALQAGSDIAVRYVTNKLIGKTFAGSLASQSFMATNPYTFAASLALGETDIGEKAGKVAKKIVKPVKKVVKKAKSFFKKAFSDIRLKTNIEFIGKSPSNINIYSFNYIGSPITYTGVMAHEVPWASEKHSNGYLMVDYNKLDVDFKRLN